MSIIILILFIFWHFNYLFEATVFDRAVLIIYKWSSLTYYFPIILNSQKLCQDLFYQHQIDWPQDRISKNIFNISELDCVRLISYQNINSII